MASYTLTGADRRSGTAKVYTATLDQAATAITNAFASWRYHGMLFVSVPERYDPVAGRWTSTRATNEWGLSTSDEPLALVPWGSKMLPYFAQFDITLNQVFTNQCKITITTISDWVPYGKEIGIHGGWVGSTKHIPPVLAEETNVLLEIETHLQAVRSGTVIKSARMSDAVSTAEWLRKWQGFAESNPAVKEDLLRAIRLEPDPGLRGALLQVLMALTNSAPK